jgi:hypothetical protein
MFETCKLLSRTDHISPPIIVSSATQYGNAFLRDGRSNTQGRHGNGSL